ncbi:MAG: hypothetical protein QOI55_849, partial [Actinomycetota bacterium]|nr:hypothetical protein [Actinomycetota bacterium]
MDRSRVAGLRGILFTDIVGSTQLRSRLGDDLADELRRAHDALATAAVTANSGDVTRWTGDGCKAAFPTASAALAAALDMQRAVTKYGSNADAVTPFEIRVGVSVGEVTYDETDEDVHGVAAVEAARLEAMAAPGEILATDLVRQLGQRRVDATFEEVGSHELKGLDRPVAVVRVIDTTSAMGTRPLPGVVALDPRFPIVGREAELSVALRRWGEVRSGAAATLLVAGRPGFGKSRFIAQVAARAHADGALVLGGACDSDLGVPYQPLAAALREAALDEELDLAVVHGTGSLAPLFPSRAAGRFDDAGPSARFELFEAVVALVGRLATEQPLVLVIEDVHWATPATLQLLRHLMHSDSTS